MNIIRNKITKPLNITTILIFTGILLLLFASFALFEFSRSKKDLVSMLKDEGLILLDALAASGERSILSYEELEQLMQNRLLNSAYWIEEVDFTSGLTRSFLDQFALTMNFYRIHVFARTGNRVMSSTPPHQEQSSIPRVDRDKVVQEYLLNSDLDSLIIGFREGQFLKEPRYAVVVRRRKGGGIVVAADAKKLAALRKELGPGRLIQEIGSRPGIVYLTLQDTLGILLASKGVGEMTRISSDSFLYNVFTNKTTGSRFSSYKGNEVFEIAGSFMMEGDHLGIFRIGLKTDHYRNILRNAKYRLFFIALILVLAGIFGLSFMMVNQNIKLLSESYQRVKTHTGEILQNMKDAVVATDGEGRITVFNEAAATLFSLPHEKVVGRLIQSLDIPSLSILQKSLAISQPIDKPHEKVIIENKKRILSLRTSILKRDDNDIDTVILVASDLTLQSHLEEKLRQQEKLSAMGKLASGVAHEIRNPMNAIGMIAQRFLKEFEPREGEEEYKNMARTVVRETKRSNEIVHRFLQFAKQPALNVSPVSVRPFLNEIHDLLRSSADAQGVDLIIQVNEKPTLHLDRNQMKQALLNLVQNGLDATPPGGCVRITGNITGGYYVISVSDTGSGISEENLHKIYDLYYTTKKEGTGMGLPIAYQIVQSHGGDIDVESQEGQGTTFKIRLPLEELR